MRASLPDKLERFMQRAHNEGLSLEFDKNLDTLFLYPGTSRGVSFLERLADSIYAEMDPDSEDLVGFEVQGFTDTLATSGAGNAAFGMLYPIVVHYGIVTLPADSEAPGIAVRDLYRTLATPA